MDKGLFHPQKPLDVFDAIYGRSDDDAIIAIGSRRPDKSGDEVPHYLYPLRVRDRYEMLPTLFEYCIDQTQYLMPNTLHQGALLNKPDALYREGLKQGRPRYFKATNHYVRELCAITIDLDVGRPNTIKPGEAIGVVLQMCLDQKMVWPSLVALSGQGVYLMFLLRDEDDLRPPANTADNRARWRLVLEEILSRTQNLEADHKAKRLANWVKRPGTIDTKTGKEVVYLTLGINALSNVPLYRLSGLMQFFGLHHEPAPKVIDACGHATIAAKQLPSSTDVVVRRAPRKEPVRKVRPGKGGEPYARRANEIELLSQHRKGMPEGQRTVTLFHYFQALRAQRLILYRNDDDGATRANQEAIDAALRLNQTFRPPLSGAEVRRACRVKAGNRMARSTTIAMDLKVQQAEIRSLKLTSIMPPALKSIALATNDRIKRKAKQYADRRRELVDEMLKKGMDARAILAEVRTHHQVLFGDKITRQFVYARRRKLEAEAPSPWFGNENVKKLT